MPQSDLGLYFIALIPPEPLRGQMMEVKKRLAETFHTQAALKSPPHITLHMPFRLKASKYEALVQSLEELAQAFSPFSVQLHGYRGFPPRVVYAHVENSPELYALFKHLAQVMRGFQQFQADYKGRGFTPHLTVAFRDLKPALYPEALAMVQQNPLAEHFVAEGFYLLHHDGHQWQMLQHFLFKA
ncbi:2'-5' RNA ligase family protein [Cytophagales bacterium LB-30]|uniref:2'-5' RNA ligase family protein n=1 Tax=Shiella aurantiaca TaxID=3058365 RepID=A0ABT8F8F5_9BACT|nr:2'-5' RNA ligase family protein [Shiella aurantiaca]MDN4166768.1 2'-5' RNA ligase family protein [Shiella aurantiaca]